jgi:hypothetical protein
MFLIRWLRRIFHPCNFGCHHWSMPGGWCEDCGKCDTFFGDHLECGKTCHFYEQQRNKDGEL